jgi:DNA segregation ATPase FtsK/SpoIIIE-like protein
MLGAGFILGAMMLVGVVMMTQYDITTILALMTRRVKPSELEPISDDAVEAPPPMARVKEPKAATAAKSAAVPARNTLMPLPEDDDPLEHLEADEPRRPGLLGRLFGRREPVLPEPDPSESQEIPLTDFSDGYDADALAAARALEEARIDEEYERALREEAHREPVPVVEEQQEIVFRDCTGEVELKTGNPKNDDDGDVMAGGLAKLFPSRWEKEPGSAGATRREKSEPAIRSAAEARAFRRVSDGMELDGTMPSASLGMDGLSGENDPLFDPELETRPAGVEGALRAREVSAVALQEAEDERVRRSRDLAGYRLPDIGLLNVPPKIDNRMTREEMMEISQTLEKTFADFNIEARVVEIMQGPVVTRFELKPAPGVKVSRIVSLEHDIAMAMQAESVRIVAPIPGKAAVGIEIPNKNRQGVYFKELVSCTEFWDHPSPLAFALGKTIDGQPYFADLKKMPHLLIAGATGAGKSVCLNTIICSMLYRMRPDRLRLLMVDPKRVELSIYQDIPHLISPVVCDAKRAAAALNWAVEQMEERYQKLVDFNVRNIDGYNEIATNPEKQARFRGKNLDPMPHMVVIVDELADLMVVAKNEVEESIQRLAQMSRAVGIHLILATQRPSVNVITGIIKANFPTRIAFQVSQKVDSRTILDSNGAEALLGRGDMLFAPAGAGKPIRVQGCFLSDDEVERIAATCRDQIGPMYEVDEFEPMLSEKEQRELAKLMGAPTDMDDLDMQGGMAAASRGTNRTMGKVSAGMFVPHDGGSAQAGEDEIDEALVRAAARLILEARKGSTSLVQRRLKVGFARAGRLMDMLEEMGIVGPYKGSKPRDILVDPDAALAQLDQLEMQIAASGGNSRRAAELLDGGTGDEEFLDEEYDEDEERR